MAAGQADIFDFADRFRILLFALGTAVLVRVMLGSLVCVMASMGRMTMRDMGMMRALLVAACFMVFGSFPVVVSSMTVMFGSFGVVFSTLMFHGLPPDGQKTCNSLKELLQFIYL